MKYRLLYAYPFVFSITSLIGVPTVYCQNPISNKEDFVKSFDIYFQFYTVMNSTDVGVIV